MNIAWGIVVAQCALLLSSLLLLGFSLGTGFHNRTLHSFYCKLAFILLTAAVVLTAPMLLLHGLVIGLADHLLVFGVPVATVIVAYGIIGRAKPRNHAHPNPPAA